MALPGDDVKVSFPKATLPPEAISEFYTIVDFYESKMSEYDTNFVFVPIRSLQESRGMVDPETDVGRFTSIQIKLRPDADANQVRDLLRNHFPAQLYMVSTWRDKQGPLLAAVEMETNVLNLLLFMIIAVAGFGILAIFYMIVVEKTRDIGILKSLGASGRGIMGIFLGYGLSLWNRRLGCGVGDRAKPLLPTSIALPTCWVVLQAGPFLIPRCTTSKRSRRSSIQRPSLGLFWGR